MRNRSRWPWFARQSGDRPRIEVAIVLAWAAIALVTADQLAIRALQFIEPAWSDLLADLDRSRRVLLVGAPAAAAVLVAFAIRLFRLK
jgi:hypothetical protein